MKKRTHNIYRLVILSLVVTIIGLGVIGRVMYHKLLSARVRIDQLIARQYSMTWIMDPSAFTQLKNSQNGGYYFTLKPMEKK